MWIIFEGLDKVGKGTLESLLNQETKYEHIIIDRGPAGFMFYDELYDRATDSRLKEYKKQAKLMRKSDDFVVIYVTADWDHVNMRLEKHKEEWARCRGVSDYQQQRLRYASLCNKYYGVENIMFIDTTFQLPEWCVGEIRKFIESVKERRSNEHK